MLDLKRLLQDPDGTQAILRKRDPSVDLSPLVTLDQERREAIQRDEQLKAEQKAGAAEIGQLKRTGGDTAALEDRMRALKEEGRVLEERRKAIEDELIALVEILPNIPHGTVPLDLDKKNNRVIREGGPRPLREKSEHHLDIANRLGWLDFEAGARIAGSGFPVYVGDGFRLEWALLNYFLERNATAGYVPMGMPQLNNAASLYASGQFPKFREQVYQVPQDDLYLIPTSEVALCNLHRDEILEPERLPLKYTAYTACFRREAGAHGAHERGLIRVHQFNKVELFLFTKPEESYDALEAMTAHAESLVEGLGLPWRTSLLVSGDLGSQATKTYDVEVWLPGQQAWYEVSSCSNCEDYQARRGNIRYRDPETRKPRFVHTLNGSGLATSRLFVAILENNLQEDGSVRWPEVLMGGRVPA
ncbi:MAG TPA: serine--tRNA ligase [bacterium]|nr:serine--tRNA ligase [bacterium]